MNVIEKLNSLKAIKLDYKKLGLESFSKLFSTGGKPVFLSISDLDLDTDGKKNPNIRYESTHQSQTSIDGSGTWLDSNTINFIVLPGGFEKDFGGVHIGCLATVIYKDKIAHAIYADVGPSTKYGEGSIALHRALGFERVKNGKIVDVGIDNGVKIILHINSKISKTPCTQEQINSEANKEFLKLLS